MSVARRSMNDGLTLRPALVLLAAAGMSFGISPVLAQSFNDRSSGPLYPEDVPVYSEPERPQTTGSSNGSDGNAHAAGSKTSGVNVSEYMTVDIFVQDEDLANVLQMLSLQSRRNIVASREVSASVSANLYSVTFYEALDAILHVNGYSYYEEGNFIYVVPVDVAARRAEAQREIVAKVVTLNYLNANDAAEFVTPLLSEVGQIKTNGDTGSFSIPQDAPTGGEDFALGSTLVIYDYPEHVDEIEALLNQLDTRPAQVLVEATILQTQLTEANAFGVDFAILADINFIDFFNFGGPLGSASALAGTGADEVAPIDGRATSIVGTPGNFAGPATFKAGIIHDDLAIFVRALDEVTDVTILSNPKILALNRQPARVLVGRKLGYLNTTSTETSTTQTVQFLDTGTQLSFRPFISKDGNVRLELKPRVSEGVIRQATDVTGAAVTIPDEITQELTTNVIVPDGSTVVLGGLFKETTTLKRRQVPILGDIPILGVPFRGHDDDTDRAEIIFMIKPTIVNDKILIEQGDRALAYGDNVRTGTRSGLLPFSRDRQTAQLNVKAERLAADGEVERAMWHLRRSRELNPNQPAAIRLMEELQNEEINWPTPSLLDRIIEGEVRNTYSKLGQGDPPYIGMPIGAYDHYMPPQEEVGIEPWQQPHIARANAIANDSLAQSTADSPEPDALEDDWIWGNESLPAGPLPTTVSVWTQHGPSESANTSAADAVQVEPAGNAETELTKVIDEPMSDASSSWFDAIEELRTRPTATSIDQDPTLVGFQKPADFQPNTNDPIWMFRGNSFYNTNPIGARATVNGKAIWTWWNMPPVSYPDSSTEITGVRTTQD